MANEQDPLMQLFGKLARPWADPSVDLSAEWCLAYARDTKNDAITATAVYNFLVGFRNAIGQKPEPFKLATPGGQITITSREVKAFRQFVAADDKYFVYVPDNAELLLLGQHVVIWPTNGHKWNYHLDPSRLCAALRKLPSPGAFRNLPVLEHPSQALMLQLTEYIKRYKGPIRLHFYPNGDMAGDDDLSVCLPHARCACCRAVSLKLSRCLKCKTALYCGRACQQKDWDKTHKVECSNLVRKQPASATVVAAATEKHPEATTKSDEPKVASNRNRFKKPPPPATAVYSATPPSFVIPTMASEKHPHTSMNNESPKLSPAEIYAGDIPAIPSTSVQLKVTPTGQTTQFVKARQMPSTYLN